MSAQCDYYVFLNSRKKVDDWYSCYRWRQWQEKIDDVGRISNKRYILDAFPKFTIIEALEFFLNWSTEQKVSPWIIRTNAENRCDPVTQPLWLQDQLLPDINNISDA